jgi:hypothetical protein
MTEVQFIGILIVAAAFLTLVIILVLPPILRGARIASRAHRDYEQARGTLHLHQIRESLVVLNARLNELETEKRRISYELHQAPRQQSQELSRALCRHLAKTRLTDVDGIGPKLRDSILATCFDGTLDSLTRAQHLVRGVGDVKALAIRAWVSKWKPLLPELMETSFPEKCSINDRYARAAQQRRKKIREIETNIETLTHLHDPASAEALRLSKVTVEHFLQALKQDVQASEKVDLYLQGAFPEWGPMPAWFKTLVAEYRK